jgi:hypothetical protein
MRSPSEKPVKRLVLATTHLSYIPLISAIPTILSINQNPNYQIYVRTLLHDLSISSPWNDKNNHQLTRVFETALLTMYIHTSAKYPTCIPDRTHSGSYNCQGAMFPIIIKHSQFWFNTQPNQLTTYQFVSHISHNIPVISPQYHAISSYFRLICTNCSHSYIRNTLW